MTANGLPHRFRGHASVSLRFRNLNLLLLALTSLVLVAAMLWAVRDVTERVSLDYARLYTANTAGALGAHLNKDIGLVAKTARSRAVADWFSDEDSPARKARAHEEFLGILGALYSGNLYLGVEGSRHEYTLLASAPETEFAPQSRLDPGRPEDAWYFACLAGGRDYVLNVDEDKLLGRKRVWLNHRVGPAEAPLGVVSTGLDFAQVAHELFSEYDGRKVRSLIMDGTGAVQMDSAFPEADFLRMEGRPQVSDVVDDPSLQAAVRAHLAGIGGYFEMKSRPVAVGMPTGPYGYATIAPIIATDWSVVTLYTPSSLFDPAHMWHFLAAILVLFAVFIAVTNMCVRRLFLSPFRKFLASLARVGEDGGARLYGLGRGDEFGLLSNTIQDLFIKVNRDPLTGVYNRRYLEKEMLRLMDSMSRYGGELAVLMVDVDHFKKFNDRYGHGRGDGCLRAVAEALTGCLKRGSDFVARYGGEEFTAILPNTGAEGACAVAAKMLAAVRDLEIPHEDATAPEKRVTLSLGVATGTVTPRQPVQAFLKRADEALYRSKREGRDRSTHLPLDGAAAAGPGK